MLIHIAALQVSEWGLWLVVGVDLPEKWFNVVGFSHISVSRAPLIVYQFSGRLADEGTPKYRPDVRQDGTSLAGLDV